MPNYFYKWLEQQGFFKRTKDVPIPSHLIYDGYNGGKLYIPRDKEYEFLSHYAEAMAGGIELFFVETRPKVFRYMIDIDITDDHYWSTGEIETLVKIIQQVVLDFFQTNQVTICCTSPIKLKKDGTHTGIHLIWPNIYVNSDTAMTIRRGIIQRVKEQMDKPGGIKFTKSLEDVFDELIYTRNGYRMVGSDKMTGKKKVEDREPEGRPLSILLVMNSTGELNENYLRRLKKDIKAQILETSIRHVLDAYNHKGSVGMPIKIPEWLCEDIIHKMSGSRVPGTIVTGRIHFVIEQFIRINLPREYREVVKAVTRYPDKNLLIKTNSKYCMNLGREHNSCGIYFFANPNGLYQKCLCSCDKLESRKNGYCKDFRSECYPFSEKIRNMLFPNQAENLFQKEKRKKKENKYVPESKNQKEIEQQKLCNKLLSDILI